MSTSSSGEPIICSNLENEKPSSNQQVYIIDKQLQNRENLVRLFYTELKETISELEKTFHTIIKEEMMNQKRQLTELENKLNRHESLHEQHTSKMESVKRQSKEFDQIKNDKKIHTKLVNLLTEQQKANEKIVERLSEFSQRNSPIISLFESLPLNYPLKAIYVNGLEIGVSNYITLEQQRSLVHFLNNNEVKTILSDMIDGVKW